MPRMGILFQDIFGYSPTIPYGRLCSAWDVYAQSGHPLSRHLRYLIHRETVVIANRLTMAVPTKEHFRKRIQMTSATRRKFLTGVYAPHGMYMPRMGILLLTTSPIR